MDRSGNGRSGARRARSADAGRRTGRRAGKGAFRAGRRRRKQKKQQIIQSMNRLGDVRSQQRAPERDENGAGGAAFQHGRADARREQAGVDSLETQRFRGAKAHLSPNASRRRRCPSRRARHPAEPYSEPSEEDARLGNDDLGYERPAKQRDSRLKLLRGNAA